MGSDILRTQMNSNRMSNIIEILGEVRIVSELEVNLPMYPSSDQV